MGNICTLKHFHKWFHFSLVLSILENRNIQSYGYSIYEIKNDLFHQIVVYYLKWYFNIYLVFIFYYISNFLQVNSTHKRNIRGLITFITFPSFKRMCNLRLQTDFCTIICLLCVCKSDQRLWIVSHQHNFRLHLFTKRNSTLD